MPTRGRSICNSATSFGSSFQRTALIRTFPRAPPVPFLVSAFDSLTLQKLTLLVRLRSVESNWEQLCASLIEIGSVFVYQPCWQCRRWRKPLHPPKAISETIASSTSSRPMCIRWTSRPMGRSFWRSIQPTIASKSSVSPTPGRSLSQKAFRLDSIR